MSCGEASGDLYAGALVTELRRRVPSADIFGFGGDRMKAAGAIVIHTTPSAAYPWSVVQTSWAGPQFDLPDDPEPRLDGDTLSLAVPGAREMRSVPFPVMRDVADRIRRLGGVSYLEVVSTTSEAVLRSLETARALGARVAVGRHQAPLRVGAPVPASHPGQQRVRQRQRSVVHPDILRPKDQLHAASRGNVASRPQAGRTHHVENAR